MADFSKILLILAFLKLCDGGSGKYLYNAFGEVTKGNFTYYSIVFDGTILLELTSVTGDCDLYVSQNTVKPTYEPDSYCLQSMTCGVDTVIVPRSFKRPVGIGIFGYPLHPVCRYHLLFYEIDDALDVFNYDYYSDYSMRASGNDKHLKQDTELSVVSDKKKEEVKDIGEKKEKKKDEEGEDEEVDDRSYYEDESLLWLFIEYMLDCLIDLVL